MLREARDHLSTAVERGRKKGLSRGEAEIEAVRRFGTTRRLVGGELREAGPLWGLSLVAVGAIAITVVVAAGGSAAVALGPDPFNYHVPPPVAAAWEGDEVGSATSGINPWAISAASRSDAWIVGQPRSHLVSHNGGLRRVYDVGYPQAWHWRGRSWHVVRMARAGVAAEFHAVAAIPGGAWAVGATAPDFRRARPLVERWDGSRWTISLHPKNARGLLLAVSASAPDNVWAVGGVFPPHEQRLRAEHLLPLAERWDGRAWQRVPLPWAKPGMKLDKVVALSPSDVWVASTGFFGQVTSIFVEHWDGTSWTSIRAPFGPHAPIAGFTATTGGNAWAVGAYTHDGYTRTLAARWDGKRWGITPTPNPSTVSTLTAVTAVSPTDAWAIGLTGQQNIGFFLHWDGQRWTRQPASDPFTAQTINDGLAVSQAADGSVFAFGHTQGPQGTTIMRWQPPCWVPVPSPDSKSGAPEHQPCSAPTGGSPPVVNPNAPAQRRATVANAELTLTKVLLVAQQDAYDVSHHTRFVYQSFNAGEGGIVQNPPMRHVGFETLDGLGLMHLGHLAKALTHLQKASHLLNRHLATQPSDVPTTPPSWAVAWLMTRLPHADRKIAHAIGSLPPKARQQQVRYWATKAIDWLVADGIVNTTFFKQSRLPQFRPTWLAPGARWREINLRYHDMILHSNDQQAVQADLTAIRSQLPEAAR